MVAALVERGGPALTFASRVAYGNADRYTSVLALLPVVGGDGEVDQTPRTGAANCALDVAYLRRFFLFSI